ncbi:MAG: hypothetical protein ACJ71U_02290 [Terriglobales bacterium]
MNIFLSHAAKTPVAVIRKLITERGATVHDSFDIAPAQEISASLIDQIMKADAVIAVFEEESPNLFFELGLAVASGKSVLAIVNPERLIPPFLAELPYVTSDLRDSTTLRYSLDQFIKGLSKSRPMLRESKLPKNRPEKINELQDIAERFATMRLNGSPLEAEELFHQFLETAGISVVQETSRKDQGADFVIWRDELRSIVGSPILVEIKLARFNGFSFRAAYSNLRTAVESTGTPAGMLLYLDRDKQRFERPNNWSAAVLSGDLEDFAKSVARLGFDSAVVQLRSEYVHGLAR